MIPPPDPDTVSANIDSALAEDVGDGDLTAALIDHDARLRAAIICRQDGVMAGRPWVDAVFTRLDPDLKPRWNAVDGDSLHVGQTLCRVEGRARAILTGERTALNFLQLLSGTATLTRRYADAVTGTGARLLDTRKTLPGLRMAQKYAVAVGGGHNHRLGLFDAVMIKENHIAAAGGLEAALKVARRATGRNSVIVEVENLDQLAAVAASGLADRALLDNFDTRLLAEAAKRHGGTLDLEASGGITLANIRSIAETGVHWISVGEITKRVEPLDLSMRFE